MAEFEIIDLVELEQLRQRQPIFPAGIYGGGDLERLCQSATPEKFQVCRLAYKQTLHQAKSRTPFRGQPRLYGDRGGEDIPIPCVHPSPVSQPETVKEFLYALEYAAVSQLHGICDGRVRAENMHAPIRQSDSVPNGKAPVERAKSLVADNVLHQESAADRGKRPTANDILRHGEAHAERTWSPPLTIFCTMATG